MVTGLVIWPWVCLYGHWIGYMVTGWLYGHWFGYMVTGLGIWSLVFVIWTLIWLYGHWFCYMVIGFVVC